MDQQVFGRLGVVIRHVCAAVASAGLWMPGVPLRAQDTAQAPAETASPSEANADSAAAPAATAPVAAYVNGTPIFVAEVEAGYQLVLRGGRAGRLKADDIKAELLNQMIEQRLGVLALAQDASLIQPGEIEKQLALLDDNMKKQGTTLEKHCAARGFTVDTLRYQALWALASPRYLEKNLADELEAYFKEHRRELDGTEIRASHIILHAVRFDETKAQTRERAEQIRADIESGKLDFAEAARKYSVGPSREQGGDIGFVPRHGVMNDDFGEALFQLELGKISEPVSTSLGTHLILATEAREGGKLWTQVIPQIRQLAMRVKMKRLLDGEREKAKIEFTGNAPHYEPGTRTLAQP